MCFSRTSHEIDRLSQIAPAAACSMADLQPLDLFRRYLMNRSYSEGCAQDKPPRGEVHGFAEERSGGLFGTSVSKQRI